MKLIAYIHRNSGVSYHRLICPLLMMKGVDVFMTNDLREEHFEQKGCDVFMYNRTLPDSAAPIIDRLQKKYGFKIALDIDDWWHLDPHHVLFKEYIKEGFAAKQIEHIRRADVVLTTHDRLAKEIEPYNSNVHIARNAIPNITEDIIDKMHESLRKYFVQFLIKREPYHLTRLFWQGSDTHREDIRLLSGVTNRLQPISREIKMVMSGYAEGNAEWEDMVMAYTANLKHQYKLIPFAPVSRYYEAYKEADICLVPLINSPFNRMKSNLKVLEAANLGLPCVVSDVHPYKGMPVQYAAKPDDWIRGINKLVKSRKRQREAGQELREWCQQHYDFERINDTRKQILEYVTKKQTV